jgi:hypothetical protein
MKIDFPVSLPWTDRTSPTILNSVLWCIMGEVQDGYWVGCHSLLDEHDGIKFAAAGYIMSSMPLFEKFDLRNRDIGPELFF